MLLVNLSRAYPAIAQAALDTPDPRDADPANNAEVASWLNSLITDTSGPWPALTPGYIDRHADYVAGVHNGVIVSVYKAARRPVSPDGRVTFMLAPAPEAAHLLGSPMPGGPWKQGEGRGTRAVPTPPEVIRLHEEGRMTYQDTLTGYSRAHAVARAVATGDPVTPGETPTPYAPDDTTWVEHATLADGTSIRRYPDGTIAVTLAQGARVVVTPS